MLMWYIIYNTVYLKMVTYRKSAHSNELTIMDDLLIGYSRYRSHDVLKSEFLNFSIHLH